MGIFRESAVWLFCRGRRRPYDLQAGRRISGSLLAGFFCELDGDDTISLQEDELSVGKWAHADDLELEDDGISLTREMMQVFQKEHCKKE